ncbi:hypothetical protein Tco_0242124 [Tanacetum coccineum]
MERETARAHRRRPQEKQKNSQSEQKRTTERHSTRGEGTKGSKVEDTELVETKGDRDTNSRREREEESERRLRRGTRDERSNTTDRQQQSTTHTREQEGRKQKQVLKKNKRAVRGREVHPQSKREELVREKAQGELARPSENVQERRKERPAKRPARRNTITEHKKAQKMSRSNEAKRRGSEKERLRVRRSKSQLSPRIAQVRRSREKVESTRLATRSERDG